LAPIEVMSPKSDITVHWCIRRPRANKDWVLERVNAVASDWRDAYLELRKRVRDRRQRLLLRLARHGSDDAFRRLYRDLFPPVSRYIQVRIHNREDAEDICADVFKNFLSQMDRFDPSRGSVMTWVVSMARNAVIDEYRRKRPAMESLDEMTGPRTRAFVNGNPGPLRDLVSDEALARIRRSLARHPAELREMFYLRFDQGLRVREVAEVMGISPDAAKQRFARALRALREELAETEPSREGEEPCAATD
jgi:RNA polymerase sigma-70 factor (ECF subfamily)